MPNFGNVHVFAEHWPQNIWPQLRQWCLRNVNENSERQWWQHLPSCQLGAVSDVNIASASLSSGNVWPFVFKIVIVSCAKIVNGEKWRARNLWNYEIENTYLNRLVLVRCTECKCPCLNQFQHFRFHIFVWCRFNQLAECFTIFLWGNFIVHRWSAIFYNTFKHQQRIECCVRILRQQFLLNCLYGILGTEINMINVIQC